MPRIGACGCSRDLWNPGLTFSRALYHLSYVLLFRGVSNLQSTFHHGRENSLATTIAHCQAMESNLFRWSQISPTDFTRGCSATLFFRFICTFALLPAVKVQPEAETALATNCRFLFNISQYWPAAKVMLQGLKALACEMNTMLPESCGHYLEDSVEFESSDDILPKKP